MSYSHKDKSFAKRLASDLRDHGHDVWIDETKLLIGDSLFEKIGDAINNMDFVVAIISLASIKSRWVQKELEIALNREIGERRVVVLPILVDDVILPPFLKGKVYADFRSGKSYQESLSKIVDRLGPATEAATLQLEKMAIKPYLFIETSRHGYLRVPNSELNQLRIRKKISEFSYMDNLYTYLEEDCDLTTFVEAKIRKHGDDYDVEEDIFSVYIEEFPFNSQ